MRLIFAWRGNKEANSLVSTYKILSNLKWINDKGEIHTTSAQLWKEIIKHCPAKVKNDQFFLGN